MICNGWLEKLKTQCYLYSDCGASSTYSFLYRYDICILSPRPKPEGTHSSI